mgnify:FL=1
MGPTGDPGPFLENVNKRIENGMANTNRNGMFCPLRERKYRPSIFPPAPFGAGIFCIKGAEAIGHGLKDHRIMACGG